MSRYVQGENRDQLSLLPLNPDEMIGEENPVRAIEAIVESMDILSLHIPKQTKICLPSGNVWLSIRLAQ